MDENLDTTGTDGGASRSTRPIWLFWLAPLAWMGLIFFFSSQPDLGLSSDLWWADPLSWLAHFTEYAVLAALLWLAASRTPALARRATLLAFALALVYAASDEFHQAFVPNRVPDRRDLLVDAAGALFGLFVVRWVLSRRTNRHAQGSSGDS